MVNITSLGDIAGRITRDTHNADQMTVGGICLPSGAIKSIRKKIPDGHPKWRDANDQDVEVIVDLILHEAMSASATSIHKTKEIRSVFWADAAEAYKKTAPLSSGMSFVKAASLIKYLMFAEAITMTVTHAIKIGTIPKKTGISKELYIQDSLVFDDEIQGKDNIEAFKDIWKWSAFIKKRMRMLTRSP